MMLSTLLSVEGFLASSKPGVPATSSRHAVATMSDDLVWTPSSRGEPGKTPRDLAFGPLSNYCASLEGVERRRPCLLRYTVRLLRLFDTTRPFQKSLVRYIIQYVLRF